MLNQDTSPLKILQAPKYEDRKKGNTINRIQNLTHPYSNIH